MSLEECMIRGAEMISDAAERAIKLVNIGMSIAT
jgi:hypothetical protein